MGKIQELYETRVRTMGPAERLQLARMILDDLARSETAIDISDEWGDDDLADLAAILSSTRSNGRRRNRSSDERSYFHRPQDSFRQALCRGHPHSRSERSGTGSRRHSFDQIIRDFYADLEPEDIRACIQYAMDVLAAEDIHLAIAP